MRKRSNRKTNIIMALAALVVVLVGLSFIPRIHHAIASRLESLRVSIVYYLYPPQKVTFHPSEQSLPTPTPYAAPASPTPTTIPTDQATPTITQTPPPGSVILANIPFVDQMGRYNYCGPANLAMALEYWGWTGNAGSLLLPRDQIASVVKPGENDPSKNFVDRGSTDVNVMPYELVDFVNNDTTYRAIFRYGGDIDLLKRLIAGGFPVITEKGIYEQLLPENTVQWGGHYSFTTGYDDSTQEFIWQDSYLPKKTSVGKNSRTSYAEYGSNWRAFDYVFIVVYPADKQPELDQILGPWSDQFWAAQHALEIANVEIASQNLSGNDLFFAMFNKVTSLVNLQNPDYGPAGSAYDAAVAYYNNTLVVADDKPIPYRTMYYQTAPYMAYYYSGRYQDVIDLASTNLGIIEKAGRELEESFFWRARAEYALGEYGLAYADMNKALYYHPNFQPALDMFSLWGVTPTP